MHNIDKKINKMNASYLNLSFTYDIFELAQPSYSCSSCNLTFMDNSDLDVHNMIDHCYNNSVLSNADHSCLPPISPGKSNNIILNDDSPTLFAASRSSSLPLDLSIQLERVRSGDGENSISDPSTIEIIDKIVNRSVSTPLYTILT